MKRYLPWLGVFTLSALQSARADTNLDNLVSQTNATFATAAGIAVAITIFFLGRRLIKRGVS